MIQYPWSYREAALSPVSITSRPQGGHIMPGDDRLKQAHFKETEDDATMDFFNFDGLDGVDGDSRDMDGSGSISFADIYDDYSESEYYAGALRDYTLHELLTAANSQFWSFEHIYEAVGQAEPEDDAPDHVNLTSHITTLFRQAVYFFDDDIIALLRKGEIPISDPLMDRVNDDSLELAKELRVFFFVDDQEDYRKVVVPLELRRIFADMSSSADFEQMRRVRYQIVRHAQGMTILDGIVQTKELGKCLVQNTGISMPADELDETLRILSPFYGLLGFNYNSGVRMLTHASLTSQSDIADLWNRSQTHPVFLPDQDTLRMTLINPFYPVTEEYRRFEAYVSQWHFYEDEGASTLFLIDFGQAVSMGASMQELSDLCEDYDMDIEDDFDKFMSLVTDVLNTTRRWDLRGNTVDELKNRHASIR